MFVTLALASAAFYGAADFLGGIASKRGDTVVITLIAQAAGLVLLTLLLPVLPSSSPVTNDDTGSWQPMGDDEHRNGADFRRCGRTVLSVSRADER